MRRGLLIACAVVLLITLALWIFAKVEKSPLARAHGKPKVPQVVAGRDRAQPAAERPVASDPNVATLRCTYDGDESPGMLTAMGDQVVQSGPDDLSLALPPGTWSILWQGPKGQPLALGKLEVEAGDAESCHLSDDGWRVRGHVRNQDGRALADVEVRACGDMVHTDTDGAFTAASRQRACAVRATWRDGLLSRRSDPVTVTAFDAEDVSLVVDDSPMAGMGLSFRMSARGARVLEVYADSPAEEAGVERGDVIVKVDGKSVIGLTDDEFVALGTGKDGSLVQLEIDRGGGEPVKVQFRREHIEKPVDTGK